MIIIGPRCKKNSLGGSEKVRFKPVCSAPKTSLSFEISIILSLDIILSKKQIIKPLIRLLGLFANPEDRFSHDEIQIIIRFLPVFEKQCKSRSQLIRIHTFSSAWWNDIKTEIEPLDRLQNQSFIHLYCVRIHKVLNVPLYDQQKLVELTLKAPIMTAAHDKFYNIIFRRNKLWYIMRIVCQQTILMKYHALFVIFEKAAKF